MCVAIDDECHSMGGALSGGYKLTATCWLIMRSIPKTRPLFHDLVTLVVKLRDYCELSMLCRTLTIASFRMPFVDYHYACTCIYHNYNVEQMG